MPTPDLPLVVTPRVLRVHAIVWTVVLVAFFVFGFLAFPPEIRVLFTPFQIATLVVLLALMLGLIWVLAGCWVRADADGLTYRNGLVTHVTPWAEVEGIRFRDGDAWAFVLLHDEPGKRALMGVMRTDGQRAHDAAAHLAELHAASGTAR